MRSQLTSNGYLDQLRYRVERREAQFKATVDGHASQSGVTGQTGAAIKRTLESLRDEFDLTIDEMLRYLGQTIERAPAFEDEGYQLTARSLEEAAIAFKAIAGIDRLKRIARGMDSRIEALAQEAFTGIDELLRLRLAEFRMGLHAAAPLPNLAPASNRYVAITDNQQSDFAVEITALKEAVRGANEIAEEDEHQETAKELALYEIAVFEATIIAPRAATDLIQRFVDTILSWITSRFTGAAIAEIAQRLIQALLKLLA